MKKRRNLVREEEQEGGDDAMEDAMEVDQPPKRRQSTATVTGEATIRIARQIDLGC
jgi:hypothetical protein